MLKKLRRQGIILVAVVACALNFDSYIGEEACTPEVGEDPLFIEADVAFFFRNFDKILNWLLVISHKSLIISTTVGVPRWSLVLLSKDFKVL